MKSFSKLVILWILAGGLVVATIAYVISKSRTPDVPGRLDAFAQCLGEKGAKFYGAFWCPHCQNQKSMFETSQTYLPYVECSTPDAKGQTQVCIDNKIDGYPTWIFADGSRVSGETELAALAEKTGCTLPPEN